jgi:DNA-binding response OmpR family regulator
MGHPRLTQWQPANGGQPAKLIVLGPAGHDAVGQLSRRALSQGLEVIVMQDADTLEHGGRGMAPPSFESLVGIVLIAPAQEADLAGRVQGVRRHRADVPVVVLVDGRRAADRLAGLDAGADDCLSLPVCAAEVLLRVRRLHREAPGLERPIELAGLQIDLREREVRRGDARLRLRPREWRLLEALARHGGQTVPPHQLLQAVCGADAEVGSNVLEAAVSSLRRAIDEPGRPSVVVTVRGRGYRLMVSAKS